MLTTSATLLDRLRQPTDPVAWDRFAKLYSPLLYAWAQRLGLQQQDAADLVQDVFAVLIEKLPEFRYDRHKSFRAWLHTIIANKWRDSLRRHKLAVKSQHEAARAGQASCDEVVAFEEREYCQYLVQRALGLMRAEFQPKTWQACWEHAAKGRSAPEVARELGISVASVYAATSRVMRRLRQALDGLMD